MQLSANIRLEEQNDSCCVREHEFQDDTQSRKLCMGLIIVFTVICVLASIVTVIYTVKLDHCHNNTVPVATSSEYEFLSSTNDMSIISRDEWYGQPPDRPYEPLHHPVPYVIILHTGTEDCITFEECASIVRFIQAFHMETNGWWDIGYNFLVGGDGMVYEGRGWNGTGAFAHGYNNVSIGIAFIGTFVNRSPTTRQIVAGKKLIETGVETGRVATNYTLLAHRQVSRTESPGDSFFEDLKTWPHWVEAP